MRTHAPFCLGIVALPLSLASVASLASAGCGPGAAAEAIRPADPTAAGALGEPGGASGGQCHEVDGTAAEPLVVDWKPEQRGDLEEAMHDGVAVVGYSCKGLKLLKECHLDGKYGYLGMTRREQMVRLSNSDELRANLPLMGGAIAAKIGGEMERGAVIDIAMVMVGKKRTTWADATKDDLKGKCDGATHFIRGAMVGAFSMDTGTKAKARVTAEMFGASGAAGSSSEKEVKNREGDIGDCQKASPDSEKAPAQCGAAVRLVLAPLAPGAAKPGEPPPMPDKPPPAAEGAAKVEAPEGSCPKGLVMAEGKCTQPGGAAAYQCKAGDAAECTAQCDKGHAGSCAAIGAMLANGGGGVARDPAKAAGALKKACDGGDARGCSNLGQLTASGNGATKDPAAAAKLFEKGCTSGDASGCSLLGKAYLDGVGVTADPAKAATLARQGCEGGDDGGCATAAKLYAEGKGVSRDVAKAAEMYKRACDGNDAASCNALGELHEIGKDVRKDPIYATMLFRRGCYRFNGAACANLGRMALGGAPGAFPGEAKRVLEQGCNFGRDAVACATLKVAFGDSRPVFPDVARQNQLRMSCNGGVARDCASVGVLDVAMGNKGLGLPSLQRACIQGDKFACEMEKKAK